MMGSAKDERESGLFSSHPYFLLHSFFQAELNPSPTCCLAHWALTCSCYPHLEYMNRRFEELAVLEDTDLPLTELNASCSVLASFKLCVCVQQSLLDTTWWEQRAVITNL